MDNGLFRKKSIERISSPEQLHDYMRVTSPRLWMLLAAVVLLLAGFIVYASRTTMENTMPIRVTVENYHLTAEQSGTGEEKDATLIYTEIPIDQMDTVKTGMQVRFGNGTGHVEWLSVFSEEDKVQVMIQMDNINYPLTDGEFDAELVLESTTPISYFWN